MDRQGQLPSSNVDLPFGATTYSDRNAKAPIYKEKGRRPSQRRPPAPIAPKQAGPSENPALRTASASLAAAALHLPRQLSPSPNSVHVGPDPW